MKDCQIKIKNHHQDHLGTTRYITNENGEILHTTDTLAYGEELTAPYENEKDEVLNTITYTGHEKDYETGLTYMLARYYSQGYGRFLSPDPGYDYDQLDPISWNLYSYVRGNPIKSLDPTGARTFGEYEYHAKYIHKIYEKGGDKELNRYFNEYNRQTIDIAQGYKTEADYVAGASAWLGMASISNPFTAPATPAFLTINRVASTISFAMDNILIGLGGESKDTYINNALNFGLGKALGGIAAKYPSSIDGFPQVVTNIISLGFSLSDNNSPSINQQETKPSTSDFQKDSTSSVEKLKSFSTYLKQSQEDEHIKDIKKLVPVFCNNFESDSCNK